MYLVGPFEIRPGERRVLSSGAPVSLGARAFDVLMCLIEHRHRVVGKGELLQSVWPGVVVEENNLTVHISALRKLLGAQAVATVPGRGYQFALPVSEPTQAAQPLRRASDQDLSLPSKPSLAVLPFENLSRSPDHEPFVDSVAEDIITELSRFRTLFVIARNSSFSYKGKAVDVRTVARELGVRYVLQGSVRYHGSKVRVNGQLIDAQSGAHIWAEKYDREATEIFAVQEEVVMAISCAIGHQVEYAEMSRAHAVRPANMTAHALAMRARFAGRRAIAESDLAAHQEAMRLAHEAVALDPRCSAAWTDIALGQWLTIQTGTAESLEQALQKGLHAAGQAIDIDGQDHLAFLWRGVLLSNAGQPEAGMLDIERAHELNPNDALTLSMLAAYGAGAGDTDRAMAHAHAALRLSPRDPQHWYYLFALANALFFAERYEEACATARRSLAEAPHFYSSNAVLVLSLVGLRQLDEARSHYERLHALAAPGTAARLAGRWPYAHAPFVERATRFLRLAAGESSGQAAQLE